MVNKRLPELNGLLAEFTDPSSSSDPTKLVTMKLILQERLDTLKRLDNEILDLIEDETAMTQDIEQSDDFNQKVYEALVRIELHRHTHFRYRNGPHFWDSYSHQPSEVAKVDPSYFRWRHNYLDDLLGFL